jgi:hypothetical protein
MGEVARPDRNHRAGVVSRRRLLAAGAAGVCLAFLGFRVLAPRLRGSSTLEGADQLSSEAQLTVLAFIGALFGTELVGDDLTDLSDRLSYRLTSDAVFRDECTVLMQYLDSLAREHRAVGFSSCDGMRKESIVNQIMTINYNSVLARFQSRVSNYQHNYYRMRSSTVWKLAWLYRNSAAAWRRRGYRRWPGVPGDWREILAPGAPYS